MSKQEIQRAEIEVQRHRIEFERALERFHGDLDGLVQESQQLRSKAKSVLEKVKDPKELTTRFIQNELDYATDMGEKVRSSLENYVRHSSEALRIGFQNLVEESLQDASTTVDDFMENTKNSALTTLEKMDQRPVFSWLAVFLSGVFVGALFLRRFQIPLQDTARKQDAASASKPNEAQDDLLLRSA
jgi:hypothetical protein